MNYILFMNPGGSFLSKAKNKVKKFLNAAKDASIMARDAKISNPGAQNVRDLYSKGANNSAEHLANSYLLSSTAGLTLPLATWLVGMGGPAAHLGMATAGLAGVQTTGAIALSNVNELDTPPSTHSKEYNYSIPGHIFTGDTVLLPLIEGYKSSDTIPAEKIPAYHVILGGNLSGSDYVNHLKDAKDLEKELEVSYAPYLVNKDLHTYIPLGISYELYKEQTNPRQKGMGYIGGSPFEARKKFLDMSGASDRILELSKIYNVDPQLIANRIAREGWADHYIKEYNYAKGGKEGLDKLMNELWGMRNDSYNVFGADILYQMYLDGKLNVRNADVRKRLDDAYAAEDFRQTTNEKGLNVKALMLTPIDALELIAAYGEYLNNTYKHKFERGDYLGINDFNTLTNAMYNMGEFHPDLKKHPDYINRTYGNTPIYITTHAKGGKLNYLNLF